LVILLYLKAVQAVQNVSEHACLPVKLFLSQLAKQFFGNHDSRLLVRFGKASRACSNAAVQIF